MESMVENMQEDIVRLDHTQLDHVHLELLDHTHPNRDTSHHALLASSPQLQHLDIIPRHLDSTHLHLDHIHLQVCIRQHLIHLALLRHLLIHQLHQVNDDICYY